MSGADQGFPVGGGANPLGGRQHMILSNFPKNCMKLRKFWTVGGGGHAPVRPPKSATECEWPNGNDKSLELPFGHSHSKI